MRTTVVALALTAFALGIPTTLGHSLTGEALASQKVTPAIPNTADSTGSLSGQVLATTTAAAFPSAPDKPRTTEDMQPVRVSIPAINLNDPIQNMGVLKNGELGVPSGSTRNVGWYAGGTVPGQVGSAVFDAHVFAAFKNLHALKPGDSIYVTDADGTTLRFVVQTSELFKLGSLSADYLYNRDDARRLTLITCAGKLTPDRSTYDHRLVVSAVLAS